MAPQPNGRFVITGANGFIGRRLVTLALKQGWHVTALAREVEWLTAINTPHLSVVKWNIEDAETQRAVFEDADAVFHLAAFIPPNHTAVAYAEQCLSINALGTLNLLEIARQSNVKRFVYFSGGNCYLPQRRLAKETDPLYPAHRATFYLVSKMVGEIYTEHFRLNHNMVATSLRVSSPYGPSMSEKALVKKFVQQICQGIPVDIHDGGRYMLDLVLVDDVAQAALQAVEHAADGVFNIGSGAMISTLDLARRIVDICEADPALIQVHPDSGSVSASGYTGLDIAKAKAELRYNPVSLDAGLRMLMTGNGI